MRAASLNIAIARIESPAEDPSSPGVALSLGHGYCAEHEGGVSGIRQAMGAKPALSAHTFVDKLARNKDEALRYADQCASSLDDLRSSSPALHAYCVTLKTTLAPSKLSPLFRGADKTLLERVRDAWAESHGKKRLPSIRMHATMWAILPDKPWSQSAQQRFAEFEQISRQDGNTRFLETNQLSQFKQAAQVFRDLGGDSFVVDTWNSYDTSEALSHCVAQWIRDISQSLTSEQPQATALRAACSAPPPAKRYSSSLRERVRNPAATAPMRSLWGSESAMVLAFGDSADLLHHFAVQYAQGSVVVGERPTANPFDRAGLAFATLSAFSPAEKAAYAAAIVEKHQALQKLADLGIVQALAKAGKRWYALDPRHQPDGSFTFFLNPCDQQNHNFGWFSLSDLQAWCDNAGPIPKQASALSVS